MKRMHEIYMRNRLFLFAWTMLIIGEATVEVKVYIEKQLHPSYVSRQCEKILR